MASEHTIIIRHEAFGAGFDVRIEPTPSWARFDAERPTLGEARRYAEGLHTVHGWKIRDETGEGN